MIPVHVLANMASRPWLMEPNWFRVALNIVSRDSPNAGLNGEFAQKIEKRALSLGDGKSKDLKFVEKRGNIGILNIRGPIVRYAGMMELSADIRSLETYAQEFKALEEDPSVETIVLNIDSPGGEASGIAEFATYIRNSPKKVVAFVDELAASAGYWIASAASEIYATSTAFVGSIGVVFTVVDDKEKLKKEGIQKIEIVSVQSPKKRPDITSEEGKAQIQVWANDLADKFIKAVARYRGVSEDFVLNNFGQGDLLIAEKAKDVGMINGISTFEGLIKKFTKKGVTMPQANANVNADQDVTITAESVKEKYPQAYEQIFKAGAEAERKRIEAIENLGQFTGYGELVKEMKFDGKSTAEMVELAVFRAEREKKQKIGEDYSKDGAKAAALLAEAGVGVAEAQTQVKEPKKDSPLLKAAAKLK
jgi:signal peptide peptidase SppA